MIKLFKNFLPFVRNIEWWRKYSIDIHFFLFYNSLQILIRVINFNRNRIFGVFHCRISYSSHHFILLNFINFFLFVQLFLAIYFFLFYRSWTDFILFSIYSFVRNYDLYIRNFLKIHFFTCFCSYQLRLLMDTVLRLWMLFAHLFLLVL